MKSTGRVVRREAYLERNPSSIHLRCGTYTGIAKLPEETKLSVLGSRALHVALVASFLMVHGSALGDDKPVTVSLNINAMSTGDDLTHKRLEDDARRLLEERLATLNGIEVVRSNADLLLSITVIQVDDETFACSSTSFAFSPACIGLVLFETGVFGKQRGLDRIVDSIVSDFDVNTLVPYKRTKQ